jgi:hypothetical protein
MHPNTITASVYIMSFTLHKFIGKPHGDGFGGQITGWFRNDEKLLCVRSTRPK